MTTVSGKSTALLRCVIRSRSCDEMKSLADVEADAVADEEDEEVVVVASTVCAGANGGETECDRGLDCVSSAH